MELDTVHNLLLIGSSKEKTLYAIVSLFSTMQYVVLLNGNYVGPDLSFQHNLNPLLGASESRQVLRLPTRVEVEEALATEKFPHDIFIKRFERFMEIAFNRRSSQHHLKQLVESAFKKHPPTSGEPLNEYMKKVTETLLDDLKPQIRAASKKRRELAEAEFVKLHGPLPFSFPNVTEKEN